MEKAEQLEKDSSYKWEDYSQITIDFIELLSDMTDYYDEDDEETEAQLDQLAYEINNVLEVLNPSLEDDKKVLLGLLEEIDLKNF